jgi:ADP-L-glycero-D-manno-heptose 6-epimerase
MPKNISAVVHLGACSSTTEQNAEYMIQNNYRYSKNLANWAEAQDVRFIYASSAATYGNGAEGFCDDEKLLHSLRPLNVYALSKQLFDSWALRTGKLDSFVGVKFFNVYGPNEYHKADMRSVVNKAFDQIENSGSVQLFKSHHPDYQDGEQLRDFIYVKDCSEVLWWFLQNPKSCGIFNLGTGKARHWKDLVTAVFTALGKKPKIEFIEMPEQLRTKYQYFTQANMKKLAEAGCNIEFRSLEDGVADYVQQYLQQEYPFL